MKQYAIIVFISLGLLSCTQCNRQITKSPERPKSVPRSALFVGGVDGGNWYLIKKILLDTNFEIEIYSHSSGELEIDTTFKLNADCPMKSMDSVTLAKSINGYDGEKILLIIPENGRKCFLRP